ncbi:hypothetical protein ACVXZ4_06905 [Lacisediminihabitans sp. FW035]
MTAWHDQPPVSRRQVRQTERDENVDSQSTPEDPTPRQSGAEDTSFAGIARQGWEAEARRASAPQGPPESRSEAAIARGRRVQQPATNERGADVEPEPLAYITQARPQVPSYDGASFRGRAISAVPHDSDESAGVEPTPTPDAPGYRNRDFSPSETGRSAFRPVGPPLNWAPPAAPLPQPIAAPVNAVPIEAAPPAPSAQAAPSEPVLTRRQMRELGIGGFVTTPSENDEAERAAAAAAAASAPVQPEVAAVEVAPIEAAPAAFAPVAAVPVAETPAVETAVPETPAPEIPIAEAVPTERPRFRDRASRATVDPELESEEARRAQESAAPAPASEPAPALVTEPPALIEPPLRPPFTGAIPTADITVAEIVDSPPAPVDSSAPIELVSTPVFAVDSVVEPEVVVAELEPHPSDAPAFEDLLFPSGQPVETTVEPERADAVPTTFDAFLGASEAPAPSLADAAPVVAEAAPSTGLAAADDTYVPPVGHWSTQALIDDDEQVQENTFARDVGATSGALTTSALVLPSMPTGEDIMGPLSGTGEILITGSINLPSSMGSTGVHPARYDHSDVDALLEADDREDSDPESAPVRAIRAISTNTASGDVINSMKPRKASRLPLILIVSAAVMAVGVVVLLVAGLIFKIF